MKDLLYAIAAGLVEDKSAIKIVEDEPDAEGVIVFHLSVAPDDMGRVIGKQGRIAKALRTIMRAGAAKKDLKVSVTIEEELSARKGGFYRYYLYGTVAFGKADFLRTSNCDFLLQIIDRISPQN